MWQEGCLSSLKRRDRSAEVLAVLRSPFVDPTFSVVPVRRRSSFNA